MKNAQVVLRVSLALSLIIILASIGTLPAANALNEWTVVSNPVENMASAFTAVSALSQNDAWAVGWG